MLKEADILETRARIRPYIRHTPIAPKPALTTVLPTQLLLKLENLQISGSFKIRGAFNNLLQASAEERQNGVVVASGGNHGLSVAYAGAKLGIKTTVILPETAAEDRVKRILAWGATVIKHGTNPSDALKLAQEMAISERKLFVHPFDAERTLHGTATLGLELLEDVEELDCVLIAIGGGGLISGMSSAIKEKRPNVRIIGVEPTGAAKMKASVELGSIVEVSPTHTIADTLSPSKPSQLTLDLTKRYVDDIVLVTDQQMIEAMRLLWTEYNQLVEPAGAAVLAALQSHLVDISAFKYPVAVICGGNCSAESVFSYYSTRMT